MKRWPSVVSTENLKELETDQFWGRKYELSREAIENFNAAAASKLFDQEVREAVSYKKSFSSLIFTPKVMV